MMNLLALALLLSSIAAASLFSPPPDPDHQVLRESHRFIVVEYERQIPQSSSSSSSAGELAGETKEKPLDTANVDQSISKPQKEKHFSYSTHTKKKANQLEDSASDAVKSADEKVKHKVAQIEELVSDAFKSAAEKAKQMAVQIEESASDAFETAASKTKQKAFAAKSAGETAMEAGKDVVGNISAASKKPADMAADVADEIRRDLTDILQLVWELGRAAARSAATVAHLLGFATAYGTCVWVSFASSHVLATAIPRQQFGIVQSRLYPVYFRLLALGVGVALAGHFLSGWERLQGYNLMAMLAIVLVNLVWLDPKATKAMFERMKLEKEEGRARDVVGVGSEPVIPGSASATTTTTPVADAFSGGRDATKGRISEVKKRLKRLNKYSSFLNVLTLMGLSWHLVSLAQRLVTAAERCT